MRRRSLLQLLGVCLIVLASLISVLWSFSSAIRAREERGGGNARMRDSPLRLLLRLFGVCLLTLVAAAVASRPGPASATGTLAVDAGSTHTCAVTAAGGVACWGANWAGQLGDGSSEDSALPVDVLGLDESIADVAVGEGHSCALTTGGRVLCWGFPGRLGDGTEIGSATAVAVINLAEGASGISARFWHTCALTSGGGVKCWGNNGAGQLGADCGLSVCAAPLQVAGLEGGVVSVAAGRTHTCVLTTTGGVRCWGWNSIGQLGDGTTTDSDVPVDVLDGNGDPLTGVAAISAAHFGTCALTRLGGVKCWGINYSGQLGDGTSGLGNFSPTPVDVQGLESGAVAVGTGGFHNCALMAAGGVKCWGDNTLGQLGAATSELCPDVLAGGSIDVPCSATPVDVGDLDGEGVALAAGDSHTCVVLSAGGLKCWGDNAAGQLGDGTTDTSLTPVDVLFPDDSDGDGCADVQEQGLDVSLGGQRNPKSFWDFFDVWTGSPLGRDRTVSIVDVGAVVARFGASRDPAPTVEEALAEALAVPPDASSYHASFDRGGPIAGQNLWSLLPPDGVIGIADIGAVVVQFGHSCV